MSGKNNGYDWAAYYAAAYKEEHKKNIVLAGKIADAQRRQADYNDNLNRICANPFWKMTAPVRKLYHCIKGGAHPCGNMDRSSVQSACFLRYKEELERQQNRYAEWINNDSYEKDAAYADAPVSVKGFAEVEVPETDIVVLAYGFGSLDERLIQKVKTCFNDNVECLIAYGDEDFYVRELSNRMEPWFKPCYSPDTLLAYNYWGHMIAVRRQLLSEAAYHKQEYQSIMEQMEREPAGKDRRGEMRAEGSLAVSFYRLCLKLEESVLQRCGMDHAGAGDRICHIDEVLFHQEYTGKNLESDLAAGRFLVGASREFVPVRQEALRRRGIRGSLQYGQDPDLYHMVYDTSISGRERCVRAESTDGPIAPHRVVSVVIPSKDHPEVLENCLSSFRQKTEYQYYEWIVVDNGSNAENKAKMELLQKEYGFLYLYEPMPFNFSKMCNLGVRHAKGDLILLLNDDMEIVEQSWLYRMAGQALQPHVGAVGAKLWYAGTEQIQHVGITNLAIGPSHKLITFPDDRDYYYGRNRVTYDMAGVTGACLMVSREKYEQVGGMDETMPVAYNDVDFCFKLLEAGYYNVLRNDAVLYHHESLSRGLDEQDEGKWQRLLEEKEKLYEKHPDMKGRDPFYHKALVDNASDYSCNYKFAHEDHLRTEPVTPMGQADIRRAKPDRLRLTVDRAELQHKIHREEPDILWIMGWCYVPGADNAAYDKTVLLQKADGTGYAAHPADWNRKDVEAILPAECNIGLAGFVLRALRADLDPGEYRVGMLCRNIGAEGRKQKLIAWSDQTIVL